MYCWGRADQGALGLGGIEDLNVTTPRWNKHLANTSVKSLSCGQDHTVFLLDDGSVMSCGHNEFGQLGHEKGTTRPAQIVRIDNIDFCTVLDVKCGLYHTVLITSTGLVLAWGDNSYGQLSFIDTKYERIARIVELPNPNRQVVQVACGGHHTMVLLKDSRVYSWGRNNYCQLGHSPDQSTVPSLKVVPGLESVPIHSITAGGAHNFVVSECGLAYGWGRNSYGQLGVSNATDVVCTPVLYCLKFLKIKYMACGEEHSVALINDGSVFTCGSNLFGQLGRDTKEEMSSMPGAVLELVGTEVAQVACGKFHTVVLTKQSGRMLSFGLNNSGQLGCGGNGKRVSPMPVEGRWCPHSTLVGGSPANCLCVVRRVFAGGNQTFASTHLPATDQTMEVVPPQQEVSPPPYDHWAIPPNQRPLYLDYELLKQMLDVALITHNFEPTVKVLDMFFSSPSCINGSFLNSRIFPLEEPIAINIEEIRKAYDLVLTRLQHLGYDKALNEALYKKTLGSIPRPLPSFECLRAFCFMLFHPSLKKFPDCVKILVPFIKVFLYLDKEEKETISVWLFKQPKEIIKEWIEIFRKPIEQILDIGMNNMQESKTYRRLVVYLTDDETWALQEGVKVLRWIYHANQKNGEPISYKRFYVNNIAQFCDLNEDYIGFLNKKVDRVVFTRYYFVLNAAAKAEVLQADARIAKMQARAQAHANFFMNAFVQSGQLPHNVNPDFCEIVVKRETILPDALTALMSQSEADLKKPLMVKFVGEDGLDWGGVTKEFFMLLLKEILNPMYGLFYEEDESKLIWFRDQPEDALSMDLKQYFLVGMICGLAIYNGVNLDLPFPLVVYKKMLGKQGIFSPNIDDLEMLKPSVGGHLKKMLQVDPQEFDETFPDLTFEVTRMSFGSTITVPLLSGGADLRVTAHNRETYVNRYVEYELTESINRQFETFLGGFKRVYNTDCEIYKILHPEELMSFIVGSNSCDFNEVKQHTEYLNGYAQDHASIGHFWRVVTEFPTDAKKKLLVFWTGSDRIPITGIKSMRLRIQRMDGGLQYSRLPVAHTCANILDLPPYPTVERMKEKLLKAIYFTSGFGII